LREEGGGGEKSEKRRASEGREGGGGGRGVTNAKKGNKVGEGDEGGSKKKPKGGVQPHGKQLNRPRSGRQSRRGGGRGVFGPMRGDSVTKQNRMSEPGIERGRLVKTRDRGQAFGRKA